MLVPTRGPCADRIRGRERVGVWMSLSSFRTKEVCWGISWGVLLEPGVAQCWCWWLSWAQRRQDVGKKIVNPSFWHHFLFCSLKNETSNLDLVRCLTDKKGFNGGKSHLLFFLRSLRDLKWMVRTKACHVKAFQHETCGPSGEMLQQLNSYFRYRWCIFDLNFLSLC